MGILAVVENELKLLDERRNGHHQRSEDSHAETSRSLRRPRARMPSAAFHGVTGEIVRQIGPHSEADPAALIVQFLVAFGNCAGRSAYTRVEGDHHHANINACVAGRTSKGRKGTSWGRIRQIFEHVDEGWIKGQVVHGLSTGEGLINAVRDPVGDSDTGANDKRLLAVEPEFARVLAVAQRQGNILSSIIRSAFDTGDLNVLTRTNPLKATGAHISIITHVTVEELNRIVTATEGANGFLNRFLFVESSRSKCLPEGGSFNISDFNPALKKLNDALRFARTAGELKRDDEAKALWAKVYEDLSAGGFGLAAAATGRAETHVLRLQLIYALLDCSPVIRVEHIHAARAVWDYCAYSARTIFGDDTGNKVANSILEALRKQRESGLTKTEISDHFKRNKKVEEIDAALALLQEYGRVRARREETTGRVATRYILTECFDYEREEVDDR